MISKDEIRAKAQEFGIHEENVERDYVFGWILTAIYTSTELRDVLILKGGAAFRKGYFETTRFTSDLDFSTQQPIDPAVIQRELNKACEIVQGVTGVIFDTERTRVEEKNLIQLKNENRKIYAARIYFEDFRGIRDDFIISIRMDVTELDRILYPIQSRNLIHPYSDAAECNAAIKCVKLEELLGTKLKCLLQRRRVNDLFDYVYSVFIRHELAVDRSEVLQAFLGKTIFRPDPAAAKGLLLGLPFDTFRDLWSKYIVVPKQILIGFDQGLERFKESMEELFSGYGPRSYGLAFYPAELRNPIMDAASNMTLLRLRYHGVERLVEPYSLVYKRKQSGEAKEYFYAYDRTGGTSSGPDIKTFLAADVESIECTEEKFEPRYPVEISKAGEPGDKSYFGKPFSEGRASRPRVSRPGVSRSPFSHKSPKLPGMKYKVQCAYCSKIFTRTTYTTQLNEHKDSYGNRCYGRMGVLVDQYWR